MPERLRPADLFDAKGLAERFLDPWIPAEKLAWKPASVQALTPGAAATVEMRSGGLLGVVGLVAASEREKRDITVPVFVGELVVGSIPAAGRGFAYQDYATLPAITADLSFAQPRELTWETIEEFVRGGGLENLESLRCVDRYEGPGVPQGSVKTTVRLTFRSPDRTLSQEEVNRQVKSLAAELASRLKVTFG